MNSNTSSIVSKAWSFCNPLRDVGGCYSDIGAELNFDEIGETITQVMLLVETLRQSILIERLMGRN